MPGLAHSECSVSSLEVTSGHLLSFATVSHWKTFVHSTEKNGKLASFYSVCRRFLFYPRGGTSTAAGPAPGPAGGESRLHSWRQPRMEGRGLLPFLQ